jgi:hypothetical protein
MSALHEVHIETGSVFLNSTHKKNLVSQVEGRTNLPTVGDKGTEADR